MRSAAEPAIHALVEQSLAVVPGCGGSVICVYRDGACGLVCSSETWCRRMHDVQITSGTGPLTIALTEGVPVLQLADATRAPWRTWARACHVRAVLALPLFLGPGATGALTIYWTESTRWTLSDLDRAAEFSMKAQSVLGDLFAVPAG